MINFRDKKNSDSAVSVTSLKDFPQESIYKFMKFRGRDLYEKEIFETQPKGTKLSGIKHGKWNAEEVKAILKTAEILHPASHKEYKAKDFVKLGEGKDQDFDLPVKVSKNGILVFPEFDYYVFLLYTLSKYWDGSFDYRFITRGINSPAPVITVPNTREGMVNLVKALTEFMVSLKLFIGPIYNIYLIEKNIPEAKNFSQTFTIPKITTFIPTIASLAYKTLIKPYLRKRIEMKWDKSVNTRYSPSLVSSLLKFIKSEYNDKLVVGDCTSFSYYLNLTKGEDAKNMRSALTNPMVLAKENIIPERRRCDLDWIAYAALGIDNGGKPRDIIMYADLDPVPAIFHEMGHFLENNERYLGSMQRASHHGLFTDEFVALSSFLLGITGSWFESMVPELLSYVTSILLKFPTLQSEFMASWYGLQLMKKLGATEKDLENARYSLKTAFSTYVLGVISIGSHSSYGRLGGEAYKIWKKSK